MKTATSVTIEQDTLQFIDKIAKKQSRTKSDIIDSVLNQYRKFLLKKELIEGAMSQTKEDVNEVMSDFGDYLTMLDKR